MYLTRAKTSKKIPIPRKGTKYVARAASHVNSGVPVVIAVRDMLNFAKTSKEVKEIVKEKLVKINGKTVRDIKESVRLFNILELNKKYKLIILKTGKFKLEEIKDNFRLAKVVNKTILHNRITQLNLHDGSNLISKDKINVGDSIELDFDGKIKRVLEFGKGKKVFIMSGRSIGLIGEVKKAEKNKVLIKFENKEVELDKSHVILI